MALVFPNNDPVAFMVAFYGCLLAEVVPVPIEVPLSRKVLPGIRLNIFHIVKMSHLITRLSVAHLQPSLLLSSPFPLVFSLTLFHRISFSMGRQVI